MAADALQGTDLRWLAERVGTPFYVYDAAIVQARIDAIVALTAAPGLQARYAMKACSAGPILARMRTHRIWTDRLAAFGASSKLNAEWEFVAMLKEEGRRSADEFLAAHGNDLGRRSTADLDALLAEC